MRSVRPRAPMGDVREHTPRLRLVVDDVERGDQVVRVALVQLSEIADVETKIGEVVCPRPRELDRVRLEVVAAEAAARERARQQRDGVPAATTGVKNIDSPLEPFDEPVRERQRLLQQCRLEDRRRQLSHVRVEVPELRVRNAAAVPEALDEVVVDRRHLSNDLGERGHVVGPCRPRQKNSMFRRQHIRARPRVVFDNPADRHRAQPFAHIPLVQAARPSDLRTRRGRQTGQSIEQPRPVSQPEHQRQKPTVNDPERLLTKRLNPGRIQLLYRHPVTSCHPRRESPSSHQDGQPHNDRDATQIAIAPAGEACAPAPSDATRQTTLNSSSSVAPSPKKGKAQATTCRAELASLTLLYLVVVPALCDTWVGQHGAVRFPRSGRANGGLVQNDQRATRNTSRTTIPAATTATKTVFECDRDPARYAMPRKANEVAIPAIRGTPRRSAFTPRR